MRKMILLSTAALALLTVAATSVFAKQVTERSADAEGSTDHVGLVTAYVPGQSITIMNKDGEQFTFTLAPDLKIVPKERASSLAVGSFVTVQSPNSAGPMVATGIVIHPGIPAGFPIPTSTPIGASSETPTVLVSSMPSETSVASQTATSTATATDTPTATPTATPSGSETPTATPTTATGSAQPTGESLLAAFMQWLSAILRQLANR